MKVSVVVPVFDEAESVVALQESLTAVLGSMDGDYEVVYVDDGSRDASFASLKALAKKDRHVKVVRLRRNFGQTAALVAGIERARGEIVVTMDADLQNDPSDLPALVAKLEEGFDVVSGWRRRRQDSFLTRRLPSIIANALISRITGLALHDYGCTLKAYRRESLQDLRLYGEMHRIIPAYVAWAGFSVAELEVRHHPRRHGRSKYGLFRVVKVILDVSTAKFMNDFGTKPIHMFGLLGLISMAGGVACGTVVLLQKTLSGVFAHRNPLLILAVFLFLLGMQFIVMGLLGEIMVRTYYESQGKKTYVVAETVNLGADSTGVV